MLYYVLDVQLFLQPQGGTQTEPRCDSYTYLVHIYTHIRSSTLSSALEWTSQIIRFGLYHRRDSLALGVFYIGRYNRQKMEGRHILNRMLSFNPSAWGHLNPSSYCDVGRLFYGVFKLWSKLQRKK